MARVRQRPLSRHDLRLQAMGRALVPAGEVSDSARPPVRPAVGALASCPDQHPGVSGRFRAAHTVRLRLHLACEQRSAPDVAGRPGVLLGVAFAGASRRARPAALPSGLCVARRTPPGQDRLDVRIGHGAGSPLPRADAPAGPGALPYRADTPPGGRMGRDSGPRRHGLARRQRRLHREPAHQRDREVARSAPLTSTEARSREWPRIACLFGALDACRKSMVQRALVEGSALPLIPNRPTLTRLREAAQKCRACPLWKRGTQTVFGEGSRDSLVVLVGEQPGDREDIEGRPFVGPAGRLLDACLEEAGIDRSKAYVTNVVKHFKWEPRGKKRIHQKPNSVEIAACRPWLEAELALIKPKVLVCLGATAAQALLGASFRVTKSRGSFVKSDLAPLITATVHPSSILRAPDDAARRSAKKAFVQDLRKVARKLEQQAH